jgi:uncharacterized protein YndB with AHSA1/START domain
MEVPDEVRKELTIGAPRERVWRALTEADELLRWFPDRSAEVDLRPGGTFRLEWESNDGDTGVFEEIDPPSRLVFRWWQEGSEHRLRVEITLEEVEGGTRLVLVERGFGAFAEERRAEVWGGNDTGWTNELEELRAYLEAA